MIKLIILSFAVTRLSVLITREEPFLWLRTLLGVESELESDVSTYAIIETINDNEYTLDTGKHEYGEVDYDNHRIVYKSELESYLQPTILSRGITCAYCVSFWLSLIVALFDPVDDYSLFVTWFAIAGLVYAILKVTDK